MFRQLAISAVLVISLGACSSSKSPPVPLEERLQGKTAEERQEILRVECLNQAERAGNPNRSEVHIGHRGKHRHVDNEETRNLKAICREMTKLNEPEEVN